MGRDIKDYKIKMITREMYLEKFTENLLQAIELTKKKNADYSIASDPYKNFRDSATAGSLVGREPLTIEQTILIRLADKDARIKNLLSRPGMKGAVLDEKIEDTLMDRLVYTNILLTYLQLGRPEPESSSLEDIELDDDDIPYDEDEHPLSPLTNTPIKDVVAGMFGWNIGPKPQK